MYVFKAGLSFLLILKVVKSDDIDNQTQWNNYYKDMKNKPINVTHYCNNRTCVIKCCGDGEIFDDLGECIKEQIDYSNVTLYSWEGSAPRKSNKNLTQDFVFIQNDKFVSADYEYDHIFEGFYILEDGSLKMENENPYTPWIDIQRWNYCVDYQLDVYRTENGTKVKELNFICRQILVPDWEADIKSINIVAIALLTSCVFLLLVLAVYCLLAQLRNIKGMIMMAYISSLFFCFLLKAVMILNISNMTPEDCKKLSPVVYYAALSSFFWLTIMSFDIWWTFRGCRQCRDIHRRGELVKFGWYSLYAWGVPLAVTIAAVILNNTDLTTWPSIIKPPFDSCIVDDLPVFYYLQVPMATISIVNIILFLMTAYNIWLIKRAVNNNCRNSQNSKKEQNRSGIGSRKIENFRANMGYPSGRTKYYWSGGYYPVTFQLDGVFILHIKLAVMMGVSWCLELIPDTQLWLFIVINSYNMFTGVAIFFLFVFKKSVLKMLCQRFDINNDFVQNQSSGMSRTTRSTRASTCKTSTSQAQDTTYC